MDEEVVVDVDELSCCRGYRVGDGNVVKKVESGKAGRAVVRRCMNDHDRIVAAHRLRAF